MKIISSKDELLKGINTVSKAVPARTPLQTLDCILIDASGSKISMYATDNEIGIETKIEGNIEEAGVVALNAKILMEFIRSVNSEDIVIEADANLRTKIGYVNKKPIFENLIGKRGDDYNNIPDVDGNPDIVVSQFTLKEMISKTIFSVSDNDNNRIITGELFDIKNNNLRIISLDGHRISIRSTALGSAAEEKKIIVPAKALSEISKILGTSMEDKVEIYVQPKYAIFKFGDTKVYTTLLLGEFFNVDQMLSKDYTTKVSVNRQNLLDNVARANLLVRESDNRPTIFNITQNNMQLTINNQMAKYDEGVDIKKDGEDLRLGLNSKFLIEALRSIEDEDIDLYFNGETSPLFIRNDEETYIYVILPINISNENY